MIQRNDALRYRRVRLLGYTDRPLMIMIGSVVEQIELAPCRDGYGAHTDATGSPLDVTKKVTAWNLRSAYGSQRVLISTGDTLCILPSVACWFIGQPSEQRKPK